MAKTLRKEHMIYNERLTSAEVYFKAGIPYIKLEYEYENDDGTHRILFTKVEFPISCLNIPTISTIDDQCYISSRSAMDFRPCTLSLFKGNAKIIKDDGSAVKHDNVVFLDVITKKKIHEMTLEEIEKKLGYSVKIVTKENKND